MSPTHLVDPRGQRFAAGVTTVVLAIVLTTGWWPVLGAQAVVFGIGAFAGLRFAPYGAFYRMVIARRLGPPTEREEPAPPRFAQGVGFGFALVGTIGYASGLAVLGMVATGLALLAAFLNAAFNVCVGCEVYPLARRIVPTAGKSAA